MKKYPKSCWLLLIFSILFCWPTQVYADALEAMGAAFDLIYQLFIGYFVIVIINFFLAIYNIKKKIKGITIFNLIVLAPTIFLSVILLKSSGVYFFLAWFWILFQFWIIYKTYSLAEEEEDI